MFHWWKRLREWWRPSIAAPLLTEPMPTPEPIPEEPPKPEPPPRKPESPEAKEKRQRLRGMAKTRIKLADLINALMDRTARLDLRTGEHALLAKWESQEALGDLLGCDFFLLDRLIEESDALAPGARFYLKPDVAEMDDLLEMFWPIDTGIIIRCTDCYTARRIYTPSLQELRGHVQFIPPGKRIVGVVQLHLLDNGKWSTERCYAAWLNGRWVQMDGKLRRGSQQITGLGTEVVWDGPGVDEETAEATHRAVSEAVGCLLTRRYSWHVALGHRRKGLRILIPTNPRGCLAFFKDRDREGSRRQALRHWVSKFYRDLDEGISFVREHLRGKTEFRWCDLQCEIFVSAEDLEHNELFKREADKWRSQRKHNQVRVRLKRRAEPRTGLH